MKQYLAQKSGGFYLAIIAMIVSIAALISYSGAESTIATIPLLVIIAIAVVVVMVVASIFLGNKKFFNLIPPVCALLVAAAFVLSFRSQLDYLGWAISGLYTLNQVMHFLVFVGLALVALIMYIVASFVKLAKE